MAKPATVPTIATDSTFSSGNETGLATRTILDVPAQGFVAGMNLTARHLNYYLGLNGDWASYLANLDLESDFLTPVYQWGGRHTWTVTDASPVLTVTQSGSGRGISVTAGASADALHAIQGHIRTLAGNIISSGTVTAGSTVNAVGNIVTTAGNVISTTGDITAITGAVSAGTTVTAGTNVVAGGTVTAGTHLIAGGVTGQAQANGFAYKSAASYTYHTRCLSAIRNTVGKWEEALSPAEVVRGVAPTGLVYLHIPLPAEFSATAGTSTVFTITGISLAVSLSAAATTTACAADFRYGAWNSTSTTSLGTDTTAASGVSTLTTGAISHTLVSGQTLVVQLLGGDDSAGMETVVLGAQVSYTRSGIG